MKEKGWVYVLPVTSTWEVSNTQSHFDLSVAEAFTRANLDWNEGTQSFDSGWILA